MTKGEDVIRHYRLDPELCAVITDSSHLDFVTLIPNETVYVHASSDRLLADLTQKIHEMPRASNLNFKIVNT